MSNKANKKTDQSRRSFLKTGAVTAGALGLTGTAAGIFVPELITPKVRADTTPRPAQNKKRMVILNMLGGCDTINMVIPATLNRYYERRPNIAIDETESLSLNAGPAATTQYRLHPELPFLQSLYQDGDLAAINQVGYPQANLSHFVSEDIWSYGVRGSFAGTGVHQSGWLARYIDAYLDGVSAGAASIGFRKRPDFTGGDVAPLIVTSLGRFSLAIDGGAYANNHNYRIDKINETLDGRTWDNSQESVAKSMEQALLLSRQVEDAVGYFNDEIAGDASLTAYPGFRPANYLKDVATLIHAGFETEIFYTGLGGFDTHANQQPANFAGQVRLFSWIDDAIERFVFDLKRFGVWNDTVIVFISEFGRRTFENGSLGTDHGHGQCMLVMGGSVNGGIYGQDLDEEDLNRGWLDYETDFRKVFSMIIERHMGRPLTPSGMVLDSTLFPEAIVKGASPGDFI